MPDALTHFALGEVFGQQAEKMRQSAALLGGDVHADDASPAGRGAQLLKAGSLVLVMRGCPGYGPSLDYILMSA